MAANSATTGKPYYQAVGHLVKSSAVRFDDFDDRAYRLLDHYDSNGGRAGAALEHVAKVLQGRGRQDVTNWRAYVYTLLKGFDEEAYRAMKAKDGRGARHSRYSSSGFTLDPSAEEFVPGEAWGRQSTGASTATAPEAVPQVAAGLPVPAAGQAIKAVTAEAEGGVAEAGRAAATPERTPEAAEEPPKAPLACLPSAADDAARSAGTEGLGTVALHAAVGAAALGVSGGAGGLAAGGAFGAACGVLPAIFTLGLSIPLGAAVGGGVGLCAGATAGGAAGMLGGGLLGYRKVAQRATGSA